MKVLEFEYTNWKGEALTRRAMPYSIVFASTEHHPIPTWLLTCRDMDKNVTRDFALANMRNIREVEL